ncbi:PIN domain-containing protein [bacterium]|nr:PIN domain-containing protein [bacterium]
MVTNFVAIPNVEIVDVGFEVVDEAARRKHSLGLSFVDSLILATALIKGCEVFVTGDSDFDIAEKQKIILIRKPESIVG